MNLIQKHLDKDNLHHAYLIEGDKGQVVPEILNFCESIKIKTSGNPDFCQITIDNFKIDEAFDLRAMSSNRGFSSMKKIFVVCINSITLDAQNVLLKMFEEPIEDTHFFLVVPDTNSLLKTLISRFYLISTVSPMSNIGEEGKIAEQFVNMSLQKRIDFIKELFPKKDEDAEELVTESNNAKALKFLNAIEFYIHSKVVKNFSGLTLPGVPVGTHTVQNSLLICCGHFFKVRKFLRMPGSSVKTLMESVALVIPNFDKK